MWINWGHFLKMFSLFSPLSVFLRHPKSAPSINWKWMLIEKTNRYEKRIDSKHKLYHSPEIHIYNNGLGLLPQNLIHYGDLDIVLEARAWQPACIHGKLSHYRKTWHMSHFLDQSIQQSINNDTSVNTWLFLDHVQFMLIFV